ncbi:bifunctional hydroxymethylpyrimidine kinase/phosphomethylpyrimidine kinase [bacterium]|nr:bifunctional hydroxymethylpyrimidine kinase/phosphomethylpyrimidine kinase [bacterium]
MTSSPPKILTIAGSDSGGGAGIQADLKTIDAHRCYGLSVITALTAQNTRGVQSVHDVPREFVREQLDAVLSDIGCDAAKTGMLSQPGVIEEVADRLATFGVTKLVVDPVMISKSGHRLLQPDAIGALKSRLIPMARVITPNAPEAAELVGFPVETVEDARRAATALAKLGPRAVLVKGGHISDRDEMVDVLWEPSGIREFVGARLDARHTHGTGCTLSSAIACGLGMGLELSTAVERARDYLIGAIKNAYEVGGGISPVNHLWNIRSGDAGV